jgi:hypothetical protein
MSSDETTDLYGEIRQLMFLMNGKKLTTCSYPRTYDLSNA